jgi:SAM-dependent methyltransferase
MASTLALSAAAERNKGPLLAVLREILPARGRVLEIASGTGQHALHFVRSMPTLDWQPTEATEAACADLAVRLAHDPGADVRAPLVLDVERMPWPVVGPYDALVCINMIHIAPASATAALLAGARAVLATGAVLVLYGPFREGGLHTAPSNEAFDASLRARNPAWGVRDLDEVTAQARAAGFERRRVDRLPANNLCVVFAARAAGD